MHIKINKNYLTHNNYKVKCAIGKRGIKNKIKEGDLITPKGLFRIKKVYFRKDRVKSLKTKIQKNLIQIKKITTVSRLLFILELIFSVSGYNILEITIAPGAAITDAVNKCFA